jgi:hypothetical protein
MMEKVYILETNLDDVSGEILGYVAQKLFKEGAKDVCFIPIIAKKSRPAFILQVICDKKSKKSLIRLISEETGTLGVRETICNRYILKREIKKIRTKFGEVSVKIARNEKGKIINLKPEFEDLKKIAEKQKEPIKKIYDEVLSEIRNFLKKN